MFDDLDALPLAEADRRILEQIDHHREQMNALGRYRAARITAAVERHGRGGAVKVARELGVEPVAIYRILDAQRKRSPEES